MNLYNKVSTFIVITVLWFGIMIPQLISADDDILFGLGVLGLLVYPPFIWKYFKTEIQNLKEKLK